MKTKILLKHLMVVAVLALAIGQAQASTYDLNLTGIVSEAYTWSQDVSDIHLDIWDLNLSGLVPFKAFQGDIINATIQLDGSVTIPASVSDTWLTLTLYGNNNSNFLTYTYATTTLYNGGTQFMSATTTIGTHGMLMAGALLFPPNNTTAFTFDKMTIDFTIEQIGTVPGDSLDLNYASLSAQGQSYTGVPVPAPLLLLGSGLLGLAGFRKKIKK